MWQELNVLHRDSKGSGSPLSGEGNLWRTCLRELLFLEPGQSGANSYRGVEAHQLLVEICSGLRSPLLGETEVFGQFRAFRSAHSWDSRWEDFFNSVEADVRKLRRTHLVNLGSQSYGSLARRYLPLQKSVVVVGAGSLTKDLLPWLSEFPLTIAARNPAKAAIDLASPAQIVSLAELEVRPPASFLIAAPLSNEELLKIWEKSPAGLVLDFRGEASFEGQPAHVEKYMSLQEIFQELESAKAAHAVKRAEAIAYAAELSGRHKQAAIHRPFGWEDAFA